MLGTIGILTGGGDAPGLNAVIRAVVKTATCEYGMRVIGIEDGFEGLLGATRTRLLSPGEVRGLLPRGGTILGTRNRGNFVERVESGVKRDVESVYQEAITNMKVLGIDALVVLGGEGTLTIANEFHKRGVCVCGVPKTIDNDLDLDRYSFHSVDVEAETLYEAAGPRSVRITRSRLAGEPAPSLADRLAWRRPRHSQSARNLGRQGRLRPLPPAGERPGLGRTPASVAYAEKGASRCCGDTIR